MAVNNNNCWISEPIDLINHGLGHLKVGKEFDLRVGLISIDNAAEVAIKIYLAINRRQLGINRRKLNKALRNFHYSLDVLEDSTNNVITSEDLDLIELFHKLRNNLYHEGNGITVEKKVLEVYAALTANLVKNLFDLEVSDKYKVEDDKVALIGVFLALWSSFERKLREYYIQMDILPNKSSIMKITLFFIEINNVSKDLITEFKEIHYFRNRLIHGESEPTVEELNLNINNLKDFQLKIDQIIQNGRNLT